MTSFLDWDFPEGPNSQKSCVTAGCNILEYVIAFFFVRPKWLKQTKKAVTYSSMLQPAAVYSSVLLLEKKPNPENN